MNIACDRTRGMNLGVFTLNEAYFRFEKTTLLRLDQQGKSDLSFLSEEQRTLFHRLCEFKAADVPLFTSVEFDKNEIFVTLVIPWDEEMERQVRNMISWSWPQFFLNLNPE